MFTATIVFLITTINSFGEIIPQKNVFAHVECDTTKIEILISKANEWETKQTDSASFYYQQAIDLATNAINKSKKVKLTHYFWIKKTHSAYRMGLLHYYQHQFQKAIGLFEIALQGSHQTNDSVYQFRCKNILGLSYYATGNNIEALTYYQDALELTSKLNLKKEKSSVLLNLGNLYQTTGKYIEAMQAYQAAIELKEELEDFNGLMVIYNNVGALHYNRSEYKLAIDYHEKFLSVSKYAKDTNSIAKACNNLGLDYMAIKKSNEAKSYFDKAASYFSSKNDIVDQAISYNNIGELYLTKENYKEAEEYFLKSIQIRKKAGSELTSGFSLVNLANTYYWQGLYQKAIQYGNTGLELGKKNEVLDVQKGAYEILYKAYKEQGDFAKAIEYYEQFQVIKDSILSQKKNDAISLVESQYQNQLQQREIENQKNLLEKRNLEILQQESKVDRYRLVKNFCIFGSVFLIIILIIVINLWLSKWRLSVDLEEQKKNIHEKNDLLEQLNNEVLAQNNQIEEQNNLLNDQKNNVEKMHDKLRESILYAEHIQHLSLPSKILLTECFSDYFIFMQPKEEVGGDFYWVYKNNDQIFAAVGDCTGHGVPGGFLTMLSIALLRGIVNHDPNPNPAKILNQLRFELINALKQSQNKYETTDGIDMSLIQLNTTTRELTYSGAKSYALIINNNTPTILKGQYYSVSWCPKMSDFVNQQTKVEPDSLIYLLTDGLTDQFNLEGEKFGRKRFIDFCINNRHLPLAKNREILYHTFNQWKGDCDQLDDVLVFCFKLT
jgi:serine phosphatase RsbU (regulator of sigma subunit)/uncharacterized protein HemY